MNQNHPAADDAGKGAKNHPFKSLKPACDLAKAGDVVHVYNGIYREILTPRHSGKQGHPITFQAEGSEVWIKGSDAVRDWKKEGDYWVKRPWKSRYFYDPKMMDDLSDARFHASARQEQVFVNGKPLQWFPEKNLVEENGFYWAQDGSEIAIRLPVNCNPNTNLVEIPVRPAVVAVWPDIDVPRSQHEINMREREGKKLQRKNFPEVDWIVIRGFKFAHNVSTLNRCGLRIQGMHWILENNLVEWMNAIGIGVDDYAILRANTTRLNGQNGIGHVGNHLLLEDNVSLWDNERKFQTSWGGGAIKLCKTNYVTIRRQIILGSVGPGIWFDISARHTTIENCTIFSNRDTNEHGSFGGILYEISYEAKMRNNIVFGNHDKYFMQVYGAGIVISDSLGIEVVKNTLIFCDGGIGLIGGPRKDDPAEIYVRKYGLDAYYLRYAYISNNLIIGDLVNTFNLFMRRDRSISPWMKSVILRNSIVKSNSSGKTQLHTRTFNSVGEAQDAYFWMMQRNQYFSTLSSMPGFASSSLDQAAFRMLHALNKITNFPFKLGDNVEVCGLWRFDSTMSQALFIKVGDQYMLIVDNPKPAELRIQSSLPYQGELWDSSHPIWNTLTKGEKEITIQCGKGLVIVSNLPFDSRPLPSREID